MGYVQREPGRLKGWFSRRAIIIGGPVIGEGASDDEIITLFEKLKTATKGAIYTEIRCHSDYSEYRALFEKCGFKYQPHLNVKILCDSEKAAWERLDENRRRQIKRSQASGLRVEYATKIDEVTQFYNLLVQHYKTKVKKPLFTSEFFENMFTSGTGRYLLAYKDDKVIGGMLQVFDSETVYDYYACGLDAEYQSESPSVAIYWHTIKSAVASGLKWFDTMGAGTPGVQYGVRDFKLRFGGELLEHGRYLYINNKLLYNIGKIGIRLING